MVHQVQTNGKLREENAALTQQVVQMDALRAENERLAKAQTVAAQPLDEEQLKDLLRLRAQVGGLKKQLAETQQAADKYAQLVLQLAPSKQQPQPEPDDPQKQIAIARMNFVKQWLLSSMMYAQEHGGSLPANFEEASPYGGTNYVATNGTVITPDQFEFVYHGNPDDAKGVKPAETIFIREKQPTPGPYGGFLKTYGFLDGHAEIHHSAPDGSFEPWESEHMQKQAGQ